MSGQRHEVFIDFDGTVTTDDVGYEMFKHFTNSATEPIVQQYRRGEINSLSCLSRECEIWNEHPQRSEIVLAYLDSRQLTPGLDGFLALLKNRAIIPTILSEGFDFYIDRILKNHNLDRLERVCNKANFHEGRLKPEFPYFDVGCRECSNCKGYHISRIRPARSSAIYVGDGHSDLHAALAADIVFARSHLMGLLDEKGCHYIPFRDFSDVSRHTELILERGIFSASQRLDFCFIGARHHVRLQSLWESGDVMKYVGYPEGLGWSRGRYERHWKKLDNDRDSIHIALEDKGGNFLGEAKIAFPDRDGLCAHDVKLLPACQGQGIGHEAWEVILRRSRARWPNSGAVVTPSIENTRAIRLYASLGFESAGEESTWHPPPGISNAMPVRYRRMVLD